MPNRTVTLAGGPYTVGNAEHYGPGEVSAPEHIAAVLEAMDVPARERQAVEREARKVEREAKKAAEERAATKPAKG